MNYIIINSNYQYTDLLRYFPSQFVEKASLIIIPVKIDFDSFTHARTTILPIFALRRSLKFPPRGWKIIKSINKWMVSENISDQDTLFVFTEIELSNQVVIEYFHSIEAPIFLIEDGTATPILFNISLEVNNIRSWILTYILRILFGFNHVRICAFSKNYFYFYHLPDYYFEGLIVFSPFTIKRNIPLYLAHENPATHRFPKQTNSCIFFNQNFYGVHLTFKQFIQILTKVMDSLTSQFAVIYFKFHPIETEKERRRISTHLDKYDNIVYWTDDQKSILSIQASFGVSFISTALREYSYFGLKPVYLFQLFPELMPSELSDPYKLYLESLHYVFLPNLESLADYCQQDSFFVKERQGNLPGIDKIGIL